MKESDKIALNIIEALKKGQYEYDYESTCECAYDDAKCGMYAYTDHGRINYISNGTLILAMYRAGYKFQRIPGTPNCLFNVPQKSINRMKEQLPEYL